MVCVTSCREGLVLNRAGSIVFYKGSSQLLKSAPPDERCIWRCSSMALLTLRLQPSYAISERSGALHASIGLQQHMEIE
eukprot:IDg14693t1